MSKYIVFIYLIHITFVQFSAFCSVFDKIPNLIKSVEVDEENISVWDLNPIETDNANVQILDKISGKVFRKNIKLNTAVNFGTISFLLRKCFKSNPDDYREVYAFLEVYEHGSLVFSKWLFASFPSVNLFAHAVYDIRVEF